MNPPSSYPQHYLPPQQSSMMLNNNPGLDGSGTINPATLNPSATVFASPRGVKRSRSPESYTTTGTSNTNNAGSGELIRPQTRISPSTDISEESIDGEPPARRKRGRPPKNKGPGGPSSAQTSPQQTLSTPRTPQQVQTPLQQLAQPSQQILHQQGAHRTPTQQEYNAAPAVIHPVTGPLAATTTPAKAPAKPAVIKALPTVRDHTTDQLTPEGDEYIPREVDDEGEKKVLANGTLLGGRSYKCRTFTIPERGEKLFMLATECARVLSYRDSYLLFNKNRSLYKIIATQAEKDHLISHELLPYSYRSRQIAIVTAKSMFRQFGSRVITNGRRVRDDYWEGKARKQGFTEEDPAGEKRPGAAKNRLAAQMDAAQQAAQAAQQQQQSHSGAMYPHDSVTVETQPQPQMLQPGLGGPAPLSLAPLPMINPGPDETGRLKDMFPAAARPRQEMTGPPYFDQTRGTPPNAMLEQATQTADYNKQLGVQRGVRKTLMEDYYKNARQPPVMPSIGAQSFQQQVVTQAGVPPIHSHAQIPPHSGSAPMMSPQQMSSLHHQQQQQQAQQQAQHHNVPVPGQGPVRMPSQGIKPDQLHQSHGNYIHQQPMWPPQAQHHPHMSPPQLHPVHHPQQQMPGMAQLHQPQPHQYQQPMYSPQHFQQLSQQQQQAQQQQAPHPQWKQGLQQQHQPQWGYNPGNP